MSLIVMEYWPVLPIGDIGVDEVSDISLLVNSDPQALIGSLCRSGVVNFVIVIQNFKYFRFDVSVL